MRLRLIAGYFYMYPYVRLINKRLAIPHFYVDSIKDIDPEELKKAGIKGVVFDKDNTLTNNYGTTIHPKIKTALHNFKRVFGKNVLILSNTVGTPGYGNKDSFEGIKILEHSTLKPFRISELRDFFGENLSNVAMIGDKMYTDVVFGNRNKMLTFYLNPLESETKKEAGTRLYEKNLIGYWKEKGLHPISHHSYSKLKIEEQTLPSKPFPLIKVFLGLV